CARSRYDYDEIGFHYYAMDYW
nr:immunoglobulin heavy chain junction region [Mus musculus]